MKRYLIVLLVCVTSLSFADLEQAKDKYFNGNYEEALAEVNNILAKDSRNKGALKLLMKVYKSTKKLKLYIATSKKFVKSGGKMSYTEMWKTANTAFQYKDYKSVLFFTNICNYRNPNNHSIMNLMGVAYFYMKKYKLSIIALKVAVLYASYDVIYTANLGRTYEHIGAYKKAYKYYKLSLKNDPNFSRSVTAVKRLKALLMSEANN